jgi:MFS family permease
VTARRNALLILALLTALNFLNYIDRYILPAVQSLVQQEFGVNDKQIGLLTSSFFLVYMCASPLVGLFADRVQRKWIVIGGAVFWSILTLLTARTYTFNALLVRHMLVGIGEATFVVVTPSYIADLFPVEKRGRMLAIFYSAIPTGAALGYLLGGQLSSGHRWLIPPFGYEQGWRLPFLVGAFPGLLVAFLFFFTAEPKRGATEPHAQPSLGAIREIGMNPAYWTSVLGMAMQTFALGGMSVWMPTFFARERGVSLQAGTFLFGVCTAVTGLVGTAVGGWLGDRMLKKGKGAYYTLSAWSMLLAVPFGLVAIYGPRSLLVVSIVLTEFFLFLNTGPLNAAIVNSVGPAIRGAAIAVNLFVIHLLGDAGSPPLIGAISDRTGSLAKGFSVTFVAMVLSAAFLFWGVRYAPALEPGPRANEVPA